ncbi:MAG: RDD family protein [Desulfatibacillum sp.]|nr:RDD family protein [Desulfatibacillum sp.]
MNDLQTQSLVIRTPEGIVFPLLLASPVTRFLALFIDSLAIQAITIALGTATALLMPLGGTDMAFALYAVAAFVVTIGYSMFLEWAWRGQTVGKRLLGLRVMDENGFHLTGSQIIIRNLLRFADMLPVYYMLGGLFCLVSPKSQRIGDMVANTVVIRMPKISEPDLEQIMEGKFNSLKEYPHIAARLRQRTSQDLAGIALAALLRRDELNPQDRLELFQAIAERLRETVTFPQEATDGLSHEQYIRNTVDILFRA